jgi:hypothetical protein
MFFCNNNKVNKLILLKYKLYFMFLCLFKTVFINLAKYNIVLLYVFIISKKVIIIIVSYTYQLNTMKNYLLLG